VRALKNTNSPNQSRETTPTPSTPQLVQNRFGSLLGQAGRKLSSSSASGGSNGRELDLAAALAKEQDLRQLAEGKVNQMSSEMDDLSATLFQQANEMVATERRARAKLEERVAVLERRDVEKRERLERLERALKRIDRVKGLLDAGGNG
jgi:GDP/GTP exchange factor Sec2p